MLGQEAEAKVFVSELEEEFLVSAVKGRESSKSPLPALTTSKLQQMAARRFGWSGKQTMTLAQRLYEQGLITYHRTDSVYMTERAITEFRDYSAKKY